MPQFFSQRITAKVKNVWNINPTLFYLRQQISRIKSGIAVSHHVRGRIFRQLQLAPRHPKGILYIKIINMKTPLHTLIGILPFLPVRKGPVPFPR